jgi:hypothetical protein
MNMMKNIFYPNYNIVNNNNLYETFGNPFIVCLKNNINPMPYVYDEYITIEEHNIIINNIEIIEINYDILNNNSYKYLSVISNEQFDKILSYNHIKKDVLLCNLLNINYNNMLSYLKQFNGISSFLDLYNSLIINEYLGQNNNLNNNIRNRINIIMNLEESNYYTIEDNCNINITSKFNDRKFNYKKKNINYIVDVNADYMESITNDENNNDEDTEAYIPLFFELNYKIDITNISNKLSIDNFNNLYNKLNKKEQYYLIMNCLISKDLCYYIINNKYILSIINEESFMSKYCLLIKYLLGYTWITLYIEETINQFNTKVSDRYIFDIETASSLPYYPYNSNNLKSCPYIPLLINDNNINSHNNILGPIQIKIKNTLNNIDNYGIVNKIEFIKRLNIFISGKLNTNILKNINWNNIAICGSIMACCLPKFNTIMLNCVDISKNIDFLNFIDKYYNEADIDIICNIPNLYDYYDKIYEFNNILELNLKELYNIVDDINITTLYSNKSTVILINKSYIINNISNKINISYDKILNNLNSLNIKHIVYNDYIIWYKKYINKLLLEEPKHFIDNKYHELFIPLLIDEINIIYEKDDNEEIIFKPKINYKFRISSIYLPHEFEFFQNNTNEFFSKISQFHLPIVRSYYDGNSVYMLPSCITACITQINIDYKYFACSRDPIDILNKYRMRGFGIILNSIEKNRFVDYIKNNDIWYKKYNDNQNIYNTNILGKLCYNHILYKSYSCKQNNYLYNISNVPENIVELIDYIKFIYKSNFNMFNFSEFLSIDNYGYIKPVKKWLINLFYDYNNSIY